MKNPHNGMIKIYFVKCSNGCGAKIRVSKRDAKCGVHGTCAPCTVALRLAAMDARARSADKEMTAAIADFQKLQQPGAKP